MFERYRSDYPGEFVVTSVTWTQGKKEQTKEWMPNPIENQHISGRAVVLGGNHNLKSNIVPFVANHRGGLLGTKKLQTYVADDIWKNGLQYDFIYEADTENLKQLIDRNLHQTSTVYTSTSQVTKNPGKFYLVPYCVRLHPMATMAYIAAFDGHKEIFFMGVSGFDIHNQTKSDLVTDLKRVINCYRGVRFYYVTDQMDPPVEWLSFPNFSSMTYREFITTCDIY